jgi:hypothetical protein
LFYVHIRTPLLVVLKTLALSPLSKQNFRPWIWLHFSSSPLPANPPCDSSVFA